MLAHADGAGWWPGLWIAWMVLIWGGVAIFVWRRRRLGRDPRVSGEAVLAERFARGEITEDEYRERLGVLKGTGVKERGR